jgi:hypothetical protein
MLLDPRLVRVPVPPGGGRHDRQGWGHRGELEPDQPRHPTAQAALRLRGQVPRPRLVRWVVPFCPAAAPQIKSGIDQSYISAEGCLAGIEVLHLGVNLQFWQEPQSENFVSNAGFNVELADFSRTVASRFPSKGRPIIGIINCVANSPSQAPDEGLYVRAECGQRPAFRWTSSGPPSTR